MWHVASIFLFLLAAWTLLAACFESRPARRGGVALLAGCLSVPAAGTALVIMDLYVTTRSLAAPLALFAVAAWLAGKRWAALAWLAAVIAIHPQMGVYAAALIGVLWVRERTAPSYPAALNPVALAVLPLGLSFEPEQGPRGRLCWHELTFS